MKMNNDRDVSDHGMIRIVDHAELGRIMDTALLWTNNQLSVIPVA